MDLIVERTLSFFIGNLPSGKDILIGGPLSVFWSYACLRFAGHLKLREGYRTGYTRKIFHFLVFMSVVIIQLIWGTPMVCLFGGMCTLVIFYAIWKGPGSPLFEAMAREKDEPHRTYYIVVPYFATLIGGLAGNILFGPMAVVGYLVTGLGDAIGEPIGARFGKHTYNVPSLASVKAVRSWEGSAAVFVISVAAIATAISILPELNFTARSIVLIPLIGLVSAGIEAISPHGWDNAPMLIIPSFLAWLAL
jgi:phytol kinase